MRVVAGVACLAAIPAVIWIGVRGLRHPEMRFWRHPILLGPFPRSRWSLGFASAVVVLALVGIDLLVG